MDNIMKQWEQRKENIRRPFQDQIIFPNPTKNKTSKKVKRKKAQQASHRDTAETGVKCYKRIYKIKYKQKN